MYFSIHQYTFPYTLCIRVHYISLYMPFHAVLLEAVKVPLFLQTSQTNRGTFKELPEKNARTLNQSHVSHKPVMTVGSIASLRCIHCFRFRFLHASFLPSIVQLQVVEMDYLTVLETSGTFPGLLHTVPNIGDSLPYLMVPLTVDGTCLLHLASVVDRVATLNQQLETPCVSFPCLCK